MPMPDTLIKDKILASPLSTQKKKGTPKNIILLELAVIITLVLLILEAIFSWAGVGEQECLRIDRLLGFDHFASKDITWRREGFSRVRFNSHGMQDREYLLEKPSGTTRIAVIGDSYVEALQVAREENFCSVLESKIKKWLEQNSRTESVQVMNFGVQAHNLSQTYLQLKNSVLRFSPDIVVLPYRPDATYLLPPDIKSGFLGARPNYFVDDKGNLIEDRTVQELWLKSAAARRMRFTEWLREHSRIWGVVSIAVESASNWWRGGGLLRNFTHPPDSDLPTLQAGPADGLEEKTIAGWTKTSEVGERSIEATWPIANSLIKDMARLCREKGCQLVVVRLPGVRGHISNLETQLLERTARANQLPYLDLTGVFHKNQTAGAELFIATHFNARGHEIAADELFRFFQNELLKRR